MLTTTDLGPKRRLLAGIVLSLGMLACQDKPTSPPRPTKIDPQWGYEQATVPVVIHGERFFPRVTTDFSQKNQSSLDTGFKASLGAFALREVELHADGTLTATVPANVPVGTYALIVIDPSGRTGSLPDAYRVVAAGDVAAAVAQFRFEPIASQQAGTPFSAILFAVDANGQVVTAFNGSVTLVDRTGTAVPQTLGMFSSGRWSGLIEIRQAIDLDALVVTGPSGQTGVSNEFEVASRPAAALRFRTAPQALDVGSCSQPVTLELVDDLQKAHPVSAPLTASVTASFPAGFALFSDASCSSALSALSFAAGSSTATVYFTHTRAGSLTLFASASGVAGARQDETLRAKPAQKLVFASPPQILNAGSCSQLTTVSARDDFDNPSPVAAGGSLALAARPQTGFLFFSDASCRAPTTSIPISAGDDHVSFYFSGTVATTERVTASLTGLADAAQDEVIIPEGFATQLAIVSPSQTVRAGQCSQAVSVQTQDSHGNAVQGPGAVQIALSAVPEGLTFFSDPACTQVVSSITLGAGRSTENFFFVGSHAGPVSISGASTGLTSASQIDVIAAGAPARLVITSSAQTLSAASCSAPVTFEVRDAFGNATTPSAPLAISLAASPATGFTFTSDAACAAPTATVTVGTSATGAAFRFLGLKSGSTLVSIAATGLTGDSQAEKLLPAAASQLVFTSSAQSVPSGSCSGAAVLEIEDKAGNPSPMATSLVIALSAPPSSGLSFFSDAACSAASPSLTVASGATSASFFFKGTVTGTFDVAASSAGTFPAAHQTETVVAGMPVALAVTTPSRSVPAGSCSPAITIEARDGAGNTAPVHADTLIALSATPSTVVSFFSDASCSRPATEVTLLAGTATTTFYFQGTKAGSFSATGASTSCGNASQNETVTPQAPDRIAFATPARSATVGVCSPIITLESRDSFGNASPVKATTSVALAATPSSGFRFFSDSSCTTAITSVSVPTGGATANFYVEGTVPNSIHIAATPSGLTGDSQTELVLPASAPTQLVFTTAPQVILADACSGATMLETRDSFGNTQAVASATSVSLVAAPAAGLAFYSDALCTKNVTTLSLASGESTATFYFTGTTAQNVTVTASATGFNSTQQTETITAAPPNRLAITSAAQHVSAGACSGIVTVQSQDSYGNPSAPAAAKQVNLTGAPSSGTTFFSDDSCRTEVTSVTVASGSSTATFGFKATTAGTLTVRVAADTWAGTSQDETIDPAVPDRLAFTTSPLTLIAGDCSPAVVVEIRDHYGNVTRVAAAATVSLTASPPAGFQFFSNASCTNSTTAVTIAANSSSASFYVRGTAAGTVPITASATGMSPGTQSETIKAAAPNHLVFTTASRTASAGVCSQVLTVQSLDAYNNVSTVTANTPVTLAASPISGFGFFTDSSCSTAGSPALATGASTASFYFKSTAPGTFAVSASAPSFSPVTQNETVNPGPAASLAWDAIASPQGLATPVAVRLRALDAFGNVATSFAGTATISITPGSTVGCTTSCTDPTTTGAFSSGVWTGSVTFGSPAGTGRTLTALSGSVTGTSNAFDISSDPTRAPPMARFTRTPAVVALNQTVTFDASGSSDRQTATAGLQVSWDFSGTSSWTGWSTTKTATTSYSTYGLRYARLAVRDADGDIGYTSLPIEVIDAANTCTVNTNSLTNDGATSCSDPGPDKVLSLTEALRIARSQGGHQAITFSGPMTITGGAWDKLDLTDVSILASSGVILNGLTFDVIESSTALLSGVEMFGQTTPLWVIGGNKLIVTDSYLHDMAGIHVEAGATTELTRVKMVGCTGTCVDVINNGSATILVRFSELRDANQTGIFIDGWANTSPALNAYGNVFVRLATGIKSSGVAPLLIRNNTFHANATGLDLSAGVNDIVRNNLFTSNAKAAVCGPATFANLDHQLLYNNTADGCLAGRPQTLTTDPLYQAAASDDYRLQFNSPAKDSSADDGLDLNDSASGNYFGAGPDRGGRETW